MKKFTNMNFAYGVAVLLAGAMAFSACSSDEEVVNANPSFDGESVKTQFAINIPRAAQVKTRMTGDNTQADGTGFLGMKNIRLYPFTLAGIDMAGTEDIASVITLAPLTTSDIYGTDDKNRSSKIYSDVTIPVGTNHFLFYGQAAIEAATDFANGNLTTTFDGATSVSDITFALKDVLPASTVPSDNEQAVALLSVLNGVESVEGWDASADDSQLKKLYDDFVKMKAGSASSIKAALESLYNAASKLKTTDDDVAAKIMAAITNGSIFTVLGDATSGYTLSTTLSFPKNLNLPDGAVAVNYDKDASGKFLYVTTGQIIGTPGADNNINVANVTYPASLYYYANTPLKASDNSVANWPTTTTDWSNGFTATEWKDAVLATTRSIAMKDNINYGVGNLALAVKTGATTLSDKKVDDVQRTITVGAKTFPITAILVGGQPDKVDYKFAPSATATFGKTIYDKVELNIDETPKYYANYVNGDAEICNYTLALPNTKESPNIVQFAIELENNSDVEFVGHNNQIVYKGSKFYLLGKLDPTSYKNNTEYNPNAVTDVFKSDYKTTAKVTITSLENAYNVIPDLRATNLEFGLSVDLEWKKGITFDVEIE